MKRVLILLCFLSLNIFANDLSVEIEKGEKWYHKIKILGIPMIKSEPQVAIWLEDKNGNFIKTINVSEKSKKWLNEGKRKEALPVWMNKTKNKIDNLAGASLSKQNYNINSEKEKVNLYIEINNSYDYNEFFTKKNSGVNGQPSIIYFTEVDFKNKAYKNIELIAYSEENGNFVKDLSKITSARNIIKKINLEF